jgi:hypothetical protein
MDDPVYAARKYLNSKGINVVQGNIIPYETVKNLMYKEWSDGFNHILHLAAAFEWGVVARPTGLETSEFVNNCVKNGYIRKIDNFFFYSGPPQRIEYLKVVPTECFNKTYVVHAIYFAAAAHLYAAWHRGGDKIRNIIAKKFKNLSNDHVKDLTQSYFNDSMMRELHERMA